MKLKLNERLHDLLIYSSRMPNLPTKLPYVFIKANIITTEQKQVMNVCILLCSLSQSLSPSELHFTAI